MYLSRFHPRLSCLSKHSPTIERMSERTSFHPGSGPRSAPTVRQVDRVLGTSVLGGPEPPLSIGAVWQLPDLTFYDFQLGSAKKCFTMSRKAQSRGAQWELRDSFNDFLEKLLSHSYRAKHY